MGGAFYCDGLGSDETVVFTMSDPRDDCLVVHSEHKDCPTGRPHLMSECGRFDSAVQIPDTERHL